MIRLIVALSLIVGLLCSCDSTPPPLAFQSTDISGAGIGGEIQLTGQDSKRHSLKDYDGKVVVLFFGFTRCPEACPTTLYELNNAMNTLGAAAKDVQVLFVTVDPERDDAVTLGKYVSAFNPSFMGLTGSAAEIRAVADRYKIVYQRVDGKDSKNYSIDHSAGSYIFDKKGKLRLFVNYGAGSQVFAHDIGLLLKS